MDYTNLLASAKRKLQDLGAWTASDSENRLKEGILSGALKVWNKRPMPWMYSTFSLVTTSGTLGPYDPPSDYKGFPMEHINARVGWYDLQTQYIIKNDSNGKSYELVYDQILKKIFFRNDPGGATWTVPYIPSFDTVIANLSTTITNYPEELFEVMHLFARADVLNRGDTKKESQALESEAYAHLDIYYENFDANQPWPTQRNARGQNGIPYDGIANAHPIIEGYAVSRIHD